MKLGIKPHSSIIERFLYYKVVRGSEQWTAKVGTEYMFRVSRKYMTGYTIFDSTHN